MNTNETSRCDRTELVRDYAFDELAGPEMAGVEEHLAGCAECAAQLDRLRVTTAALRVLPDVEAPQRIVFVAEPGAAAGWFHGFWNSAARLGFAAACVLGVGLSYSAWRSGSSSQAAVDKAVAMAVEKAHAEDVRIMAADLEILQRQHQLLTRASFSDVPIPSAQRGVRQ